MADRIILHSDLNCFYASVEVNENPKLRDQAIAVCGSTEERHGMGSHRSDLYRAHGRRLSDG